MWSTIFRRFVLKSFNKKPFQIKRRYIQNRKSFFRLCLIGGASLAYPIPMTVIESVKKEPSMHPDRHYLRINKVNGVLTVTNNNTGDYYKQQGEHEFDMSECKKHGIEKIEWDITVNKISDGIFVGVYNTKQTETHPNIPYSHSYWVHTNQDNEDYIQNLVHTYRLDEYDGMECRVNSKTIIKNGDKITVILNIKQSSLSFMLNGKKWIDEHTVYDGGSYHLQTAMQNTELSGFERRIYHEKHLEMKNDIKLLKSYEKEIQIQHEWMDLSSRHNQLLANNESNEDVKNNNFWFWSTVASTLSIVAMGSLLYSKDFCCNSDHAM